MGSGVSGNYGFGHKELPPIKGPQEPKISLKKRFTNFVKGLLSIAFAPITVPIKIIRDIKKDDDQTSINCACKYVDEEKKRIELTSNKKKLKELQSQQPTIQENPMIIREKFNLENSSYIEAVGDLKRVNLTIESSLNELQETRDELTILQNLSPENDPIYASLNNAHAELKKLKAKSSPSEKEKQKISQLNEKIEKLNVDLENTSQIKIYKDTFLELNKLNKKTQLTPEEQDSKSKLKENLQEINLSLSSRGISSEDLMSKATEFCSKIEDLNSTIESLKSHLDVHQGLKAKLEEQIQNSKSKLTNLASQIRLIYEIEKVSGLITELEKSTSEKKENFSINLDGIKYTQIIDSREQKGNCTSITLFSPDTNKSMRYERTFIGTIPTPWTKAKR